MKRKLLNFGKLALAVFVSANATAQCPTITCLNDTTITTDIGACDAIFNYTAPVGVDTCAGAPAGGNILFVTDGPSTQATEIPAVLSGAGYTVTSVHDDYISGNNTVLQGSTLSNYDMIYWHASGSNGFGGAHNAATFANLSTYVNAGGAIFITGYDVIASPTDPELITFMGGTSSTDGGSQGTETLVGANSLTTGVTNIVGLTLNTTGDHDGLNGLQAGTVGVATNGSSHGWAIRTLGAGEIAWVSSTQSGTTTFPAWTTPGSGYGEALLNFASNHACSGGANILFVTDGPSTQATEIPTVLTGAGYTVTSVHDDYVSGNNAVLQGPTLSNYDIIYWQATGNGGFGASHNAATFANLSTYVNAGGAIFITGYDVIASPTDLELINFMGGTSSTDGGSQGTETLVGANSLTTGVTNIVGLTLNTTGDHDGLNGLQAGTVGVATNGSSHGWAIRTLGAGEIAWVSTTQASNNAFPAWTTPGSGYGEALLNFASNHSCGGVSVGPPTTTMTAGLASGSTFPIGPTTITYEVVDGNGANPQSCSFVVTVVDGEAPTPDVATLADVTGDCSVAQLVPPTATDNCSATVTVTNNATLPITTIGTTVVTWTYDDGNGNTTTQDQNVVVSDATAPVADVATLADETFTCDGSPTAPTATDACAGAVTGVEDVTFPITTAGTTVVTWTYDDGNGNTSTQTQNIIITGVDTGVSEAGGTLTADATGVTYQWLDCDNNFAPISGETNASFTPSAVVGNYAVEITDNGCVDTSACVLVDFTGVAELNSIGVSISPNPSAGIFTIEATEAFDAIEILDVRGRLVYENSESTKSSVDVNISDENAGVYYVRISGDYGTITRKVVLQ